MYFVGCVLLYYFEMLLDRLGKKAPEAVE